MADKYINEVGLQTVKQWIEGKFATDDDLDTLSGRVDDIISEGGEPNVIESVKVNGSALTPDAQKVVNVTVPTRTSDLINDGADADEGDGYMTSENVGLYIANDKAGTADDTIATKGYVNTNGGKIDKIKVNGTEQTISNKEVNITVPTQVSDLTNDSNYQTDTEVATAISNAVSAAYKYKGSVATVDDLPASGQSTGDVYDVQATGMNYAWNGSAWDALGQLVDTSVLWTSASGQSNSLVAMTTAEINAILEPSA